MKAGDLIHYGDKLLLCLQYYNGPAMIVQIGKNKFLFIGKYGNRIKDEILKSKHPATGEPNLYGFFSKNEIIKYFGYKSSVSIKRRCLSSYVYKRAAKCW